MLQIWFQIFQFWQFYSCLRCAFKICSLRYNMWIIFWLKPWSNEKYITITIMKNDVPKYFHQIIICNYDINNLHFLSAIFISSKVMNVDGGRDVGKWLFLFKTCSKDIKIISMKINGSGSKYFHENQIYMQLNNFSLIILSLLLLCQ